MKVNSLLTPHKKCKPFFLIVPQKSFAIIFHDSRDVMMLTQNNPKDCFVQKGLKSPIFTTTHFPPLTSSENTDLQDLIP